MRQIRRVFIALAILCLLPLAAVFISASIAALFGCELNEGATEVCSILGLDIGGLLYGLFVMGWMALITLPILLGIVVLWAVLEGGVVWRQKRRARKSCAVPQDEEG